MIDGGGGDRSGFELISGAYKARNVDQRPKEANEQSRNVKLLNYRITFILPGGFARVPSVLLKIDSLFYSISILASFWHGARSETVRPDSKSVTARVNLLLGDFYTSSRTFTLIGLSVGETRHTAHLAN